MTDKNDIWNFSLKNYTLFSDYFIHQYTYLIDNYK